MPVRFDEVELDKGPDDGSPAGAAEPVSGPRLAARVRRSLAFLTDLSLFLALGLALSPLVDISKALRASPPGDAFPLFGFAGFLLLVSFHYFVLSWAVWGKTVGCSIFDVRVGANDGSPIAFAYATKRWGAMLLSIALCGLGFVIGVLPGGRSLADLLSSSRSFEARD